MTRRTLLLTVLVVVVSLAAVAVWLQTKPSGGPHPGTSPAASAPSNSPTPSPTGAPLPATATYEDGPFGSTLAHVPTAGEGQSRLWSADGLWWAALIDPTTQEIRIARLDWASQQWIDTGTLVDERLNVHVDAVWDGTHLTIVSAGDRATASHGVRVTRFHYDKATHRFLVDPDFPVTITAGGVTDLVVARDSTGALWLSYIDGGLLIVRHTLGDDLHWSPRAPTGITGADGVTRVAALVADGKRLALVWNRKGEADLHAAFHQDGAPPAMWTTTSTAVPGLVNATGGLSARSVETASGSRLFVAFETAPFTGAAGNPLDPGSLVLVLQPDGTWLTAQLGRISDHFTAPILEVDAGQGMLYAIAATADTGQVRYKRAPLDQVSFDAGQGEALIASASDPAVRNATSTKQDIVAANSFVVLAADDTTGRYVHGVLSTGAAPRVRGPAPSPGPPAVNTLLGHTFDAWAVGTAPPPGWVATSQGGGVGRLVVVALPTARDHSLETVTTSAVGSIRACTSFAPSGGGIVVVSELVRLSAIGGSDTTIASIRGPSGEAATIRVTKHGVVAYYRGLTKIATGVVVQPGVWYQLTVVVRIATHTYDWVLATTTGRALGRVSGVAWRDTGVPAIDTACVQTANNSRGAAIFLDAVTVRR